MALHDLLFLVVRISLRYQRPLNKTAEERPFLSSNLTLRRSVLLLHTRRPRHVVLVVVVAVLSSVPRAQQHT